MEHMDHFGIVFDSPRGYAPGQTVTGQVVLRSNEPITARFLKICFHGAAHTKWSEGERRYRTNCEGKEESYTEIVHYSAEVDYVSGETIAWSARNGTNILLSGFTEYFNLWLHRIFYSLASQNILLSGFAEYFTLWLHRIFYSLASPYILLSGFTEYFTLWLRRIFYSLASPYILLSGFTEYFTLWLYRIFYSLASHFFEFGFEILKEHKICNKMATGFLKKLV
eukprot:NP_001024692.1 ARRestin Domain protein [Caenorhabditis elegans]